MINKIVFILIFILFFASNLIADDIKRNTEEECSACDFIQNKIKAIIPEGDIIKIQLTEKTEFKVISQEDPFKIKIEFKNTNPGILNKKMFFREGIISEISAQSYGDNTIVDMLLVEPVKPELKMENNILIISFSSPSDSISQQMKAKKIIEITVDETEEGFEISIQGDGELPEPSITKIDGYINVGFQGINLDTEPSEDIPVSIKRQGDELILSFFYGKEFDVEPVYLGDEIILDMKKIKETKIVESQETKSIETSLPKAGNEEKTISLDLQDADIVGVFRLLET